MCVTIIFFPQCMFLKYTLCFGSPAKSMTMEEDDETLNNKDEIPSNDMILQWAKVSL